MLSFLLVIFSFPTIQRNDYRNSAVEKAEGATLESWVIIPRPHENVCAVLPIDYSEEVMPYFDRVEGRTLPIAPN